MSGLFSQWGQDLPSLLHGLLLSIEVTGASLGIGLPVGFWLALMASSNRRRVSLPTIAVVEVGRGLPALVVLEFVYFGGPNIGVKLAAVAAAIIALAWNTAAYTSEIFRGGFLAVPKGMREAALALGLSDVHTFRHVILPEGLRIALPGLMGWAIVTFQGTSLAFTIGVPELLSHAYEIASVNFLYLDVLSLVGLLYAAIAVPGAWLVRYTERRLGAAPM